MKITIYTITDCTFSQALKEYLKTKNIQYEEKNLEVNKDFLTEMLTISNNFAGTPVTKVEKDDGQIIIIKGFTQAEFDKALGVTETPPQNIQGAPTSTPQPQVGATPQAPQAAPIQPPSQTPAPTPASYPGAPQQIPQQPLQPAVSQPMPIDAAQSSAPIGMNQAPQYNPQPSVMPANQPTTSQEPAPISTDDSQQAIRAALNDIQNQAPVQNTMQGQTTA